MAEKVLNTRIVHKHDTEANWLKASNFYPKQGEIIVYDIDDTYNYERIKIGDGKTNVNNLRFVDDKELDRIYTSMIPSGTSISSNSDLNTVEFLKVGNYYCSLSSTVSTLTNCPVNEAFMMQVYSPISAVIDTEGTKGWIYRLRKLITFEGEEYYQYANSKDTAGEFTYGEWIEQATVNSNVASATKLAAGRTLKVNLANTNASTAFNGTANIDDIGVSGILPIANGGTGATTAAQALTNLGVIAAAEELNYMDGVTSNVQTQIDNLNTLVGDTAVSEQIAAANMIYVGPNRPEDPNIKVWINTAEDGTGVVPVLPRVATITLSANAWTGNTAPYSQVVEINTVTSATKIDLQPTVSQITSLQNDDIALMAENIDGIVTIYSFGGKPSADMIMQVLLTEVSYV